MPLTTALAIPNQQTNLASANVIDTFRRRIQLTVASPEVVVKRPLTQTVEACLVAAGSQSPQTRRAYAKAICDFLDFLGTTRGHLCDASWLPFVTQGQEGRRTIYVYNEHTPSAVLWLVDAALLDAFALHLAETQQVSHNTVETRYNAVRTFLRVALRDNILSPEQGLQLGLKPYIQRRQRHEQTVGRRLAVAEVRQLRGVIDIASTRGLRDRAILDCMLFAGLRRAEVAKTRMSDIQLDQGRYWLEIEGKGNKKRKIKVHDVLYKSLTAWQQGVGMADYTERPLFVAVDKWGYAKETQIDPNVIERITAEYAAQAGLAPQTGRFKLSPHDLRRTCAKNAYDNGATLLQVQKMLGHSDPKTTARYIGLGQDDDQTAVDCVRY